MEYYNFEVPHTGILVIKGPMGEELHRVEVKAGELIHFHMENSSKITVKVTLDGKINNEVMAGERCPHGLPAGGGCPFCVNEGKQ